MQIRGMDTPEDKNSIDYRIGEGLARLAAALGAEDRGRAKEAGLTATQLAVLTLLEGRPEGMGVGDIARHLLVTQPTATDTILTLERKGYVAKLASDADRRASLVQLTAAGAALHSLAEGGRGSVSEAVATLAEGQKRALFEALITLIRGLQEAGAIPLQRMCISCQYFRPHSHPDPVRPHHCALVDAAFGDPDLRMDCRDHVSSDPAHRAATWRVFTQG